MSKSMRKGKETIFVGVDVSTRAVVCAAVSESRKEVSSKCIVIKGVKDYTLRHCLISEELTEYFTDEFDDLMGVQLYIESAPYVQNIKTFKQLAWVEYSVLIVCHGIFPHPKYHIHSLNPIEWRKLSINNTRAKKPDLARWLSKMYGIRPEKGPYRQDHVDAFCIALAGVTEYEEGVQNE